VLPAGEATARDAAQTSPHVQAESLARPSAIAVPSANRAQRRASRGGVRTVPPVRYVTKTVAVGSSFSGQASWYGMDFQGRRTANGETFNTDDLTAASKTLAFGTRLRVCRQGTCVLVRINDRGPYVGGRILDLSRAARNALGYDGVAFVTATPVGTRTVAIRPARPVVRPVVRPAARPAKHRTPLAPSPSASPTPVLVAATRPDDAPSAVLVGALVVLAAGGLVHGRRRKVHS
jgi:rare lipoprotein A